MQTAPEKKTFLNENKVNEKNQSGTMICSDETEDSLVSLFKMISENDMRTFMDEQGKSVLKRIFHIFLFILFNHFYQFNALSYTCNGLII